MKSIKGYLLAGMLWVIFMAQLAVLETPQDDAIKLLAMFGVLALLYAWAASED